MSSQPEIDVHEELAGAAVTPLHKILGVLITLITLFDGYDTFNPAYVIHYVMQPWGLLPSQAGLLVSSGLVGFLFGAMGHGVAADRYGRRNTMLAGLWIVNILTLLTAIFATNFVSFCILRFLTGLGLGVLLPLGTTYINELAPQRLSNSFSLWGVTLGWSLGGVFASLVGVFLTPQYGWQILYYVGLLSIPLTLVVHAVLPESPKFLAARGRMEELRALLARLRQDPVTLTGNNGTARVHPLSLLEGLGVEDVIIEVCVSDLPGVTIKTRGGPVDATIPFLPFGAPARPNTWFDIQHRELFTKPLDQLTVSIDWLGLPAHPRGFAGHYEQYVVGPDRKLGFPGIANDAFRASAKLVGDAPWSLSKDAKPVYLFRTQEGRDTPESSGPLQATTHLEFTARPRTEAALPEAPGAALRITLVDPPFGFGDELYSPNVLYAVHRVQEPPTPRRSWLRRWLDLLLPLPAPATPPDIAPFYPNPPWQPEVASISIGYHSTAKLELHGTQAQALLHLLPSGALAPAARDEHGIPLLLPKVPDHAQLDLGFTGLGVAQTLTMLFRMTSEGRDGDDSGGVTWRALGTEGWIDLTADTDCRDGCNGLQHSGIVSLDLPPMAADAEGLCWIRAVTLRDPDSFPAVIAITPHALTATRVVNTETGALSAMPAKTVKAAAAPLAGVATVDQPMASFGGCEAETPATRPIRLGERLRHQPGLQRHPLDHVLGDHSDAHRRALPARRGRVDPPGQSAVVRGEVVG